jgi:tRNA pseudouridine38-40 synthase
MRVFRLLVAYDGTEFHGWQVQPGLRTVQGELMHALARVLGHPLPALHAAGRTDAGVHARGQVASFESATRLPARALAPLLGRALPRDVRVRAAREMPPGFHARHSARARRYAYRLQRADDLLAGRHAWWPRRGFAPDRLARATRELEGTHDCTSFRSSGSGPSDPRCHIARASWSAWEGGVQLDIVADHFLYHMVRNVVGTALLVANASDPAPAMRAVIDARDRAAAGPAAAPHGLSLEQVYYEEEPSS